METYWDRFNEKYGNDCLGKSLTTILEAFWYYCKDKEVRTRQLLRPRK